MNKLKLEDLTPYLESKLVLIKNGRKLKLIGLSIDGLLLEKLDEKIFKNHSVMWSNIDKIKPILKPLSSLYAEDLIKAGFSTHLDYCTFENQRNPNVFPIKTAPYKMVKWLYKNHYDVDGLIDAGLAIDKNTT